MENTISLGRGSALIKKTICIPQSFGGLWPVWRLHIVNTGPSELLNLSVHKRASAPWKREQEREAERFYTCCTVKLLIFSLRFWCTAVENHAVMTALQTNTTRYVLKYKAAGELWQEDDVVCVTQIVFHEAFGISKIITHWHDCMLIPTWMHTYGLQRSVCVWCVCVAWLVGHDRDNQSSTCQRATLWPTDTTLRCSLTHS